MLMQAQNKADKGRWSALVLVMMAAAMMVVATLPEAQAGGKKGWVYVHSHYKQADLENMGAAKGADVYIYTPDGTLVSSGFGNGAWTPGRQIPLDPGQYLIEVGTERSVHNLRKITVGSNAITHIETGWVAVTTWPRRDQPLENCRAWDASIKAYLLVDGQRHLISSNTPAKGREKGRIQLPVGTYEIHWHGLAVNVEVKAHHVTYLSTGAAGPYAGEDVLLAADKTEGAGVPSIKLCSDGPSHVLAGSWWVGQTEKIEDYPYEKRVWEQVQVTAIDEEQSRSLKADRVKGRVYKGAGSKPEVLSAEEVTALKGYKEGKLKKAAGSGGFDVDEAGF